MFVVAAFMENQLDPLLCGEVVLKVDNRRGCLLGSCSIIGAKSGAIVQESLYISNGGEYR